jgi:hypothetical protein
MYDLKLNPVFYGSVIFFLNVQGDDGHTNGALMINGDVEDGGACMGFDGDVEEDLPVHGVAEFSSAGRRRQAEVRPGRHRRRILRL